MVIHFTENYHFAHVANTLIAYFACVLVQRRTEFEKASRSGVVIRTECDRMRVEVSFCLSQRALFACCEKGIVRDTDPCGNVMQSLLLFLHYCMAYPGDCTNLQRLSRTAHPLLCFFVDCLGTLTWKELLHCWLGKKNFGFRKGCREREIARMTSEQWSSGKSEVDQFVSLEKNLPLVLRVEE